MRLLVTNDDGIEAAGLPPLVAALAGAGHEVVVAAPAENVSGASAAIGRVGPRTRIAATPHDGFAGVARAAYAVDGPPGVAALAGVLGGFGDVPEVVVSGINSGANTGNAVLHSGTVGAVLTARNFGVSGLAVSLAEGETWPWKTAAALAVDVLPLLPLDPPAALNLNCPSRPGGAVRGLRWATLARSGTVRAVAAGTRDGSVEFEFAGAEDRELPGTDVALLADGYATVTLLAGVHWLADPGADVDAATIRRLVEEQDDRRPALRPQR